MRKCADSKMLMLGKLSTKEDRDVAVQPPKVKSESHKKKEREGNARRRKSATERRQAIKDMSADWDKRYAETLLLECGLIRRRLQSQDQRGAFEQSKALLTSYIQALTTRATGKVSWGKPTDVALAVLRGSGKLDEDRYRLFSEALNAIARVNLNPGAASPGPLCQATGLALISLEQIGSGEISFDKKARKRIRNKAKRLARLVIAGMEAESDEAHSGEPTDGPVVELAKEPARPSRLRRMATAAVGLLTLGGAS